jgi:hypothetical protein
MHTYEKCYYITINHQKILLLLLHKKRITFKDQDIYKNSRSFNKAMNQLFNSRIVDKKTARINSRYCNQYELTFNGILVAKEFIKAFYESNKKN